MKFTVNIYLALTIVIIALTGCGHEGDAYFPLATGKYWRYQMTYQTMDGKFKGFYAVENLRPIMRDDQKVYVRRLLDGSINYLKKTGDGILLLGREKTTDLQTSEKELDRYILKFPLTTGTQWQDFQKTKVLIKTGPPVKTEFHIVGKIPVNTSIDSLTERVSVPAGTFDNCMRVTTSGDAFINAGNYVGMTLVTIKEINWYAPGVGLVKSKRVETTESKALDRGEIDLELEDYRG